MMSAHEAHELLEDSLIYVGEYFGFLITFKKKKKKKKMATMFSTLSHQFFLDTLVQSNATQY